MKKININKDKVEKVVLIILLILIAILVGKRRIITSDFFPYNGDFQNYNVVRRFLAGQVPFKDFTVYLGVGHLIILSFTQLILGNNFTLSLFASNMVTFLIFELMIFIIGYLIIKDKKSALWFSIILSIINVIWSELIVGNYKYNIITAVITSALQYGISPGVSARLIRMAAPLISICLIHIGIMCISRSKKFKDNKIIKKIYIAIISGIMTLWSNDGGIATYISISFMYFLLSIKENKKKIGLIIRDVFMYIGVSLISLLIALLIITRGNLISWFEYTFSIGSYQKWYFDDISRKFNISVFDLGFNFFNIFLILIGIYYIYKLFKEKDSTMNYFYINIIIFSAIISAYLYQILSGGIVYENINLVLLAVFTAHIAKIILSIFNKKIVINKIIKVILFIIIFSIILGYYYINYEAKENIREDTVYIQELGGFFEEYGDSINLAKEKIGDSKMFSTYASAVDIVTNQYQPTGTDYIIHCLGDKQREEYMKIFKNGDFEYVVTVDRDFNEYRGWTRNANWFFYKELYRKYVPVFATEYNVFYKEKTTQDVENNIPTVKTDIQKRNDYSYKIKFVADNENLNGVFGIKLNYNCNYKQNFFESLDFNKYVYIKDITLNKLYPNKRNNYNIPDDGNEYEIPLTVINGVGELEIICYPNDNTKLDINNIEILSFSAVEFEYCVASSKKAIDSNMIYVDNTELNKIILNKAKKINIDGKESRVKLYKENTEYIEITIDKEAADYAYPNFFKVIK